MINDEGDSFSQLQAEAHLPRMAGKESCILTITDADGKAWKVRYR